MIILGDLYMLALKELNINDADKEYEAIRKIPKEENGFVNRYHDVSKEYFINSVIPERISISNGINVEEDWVPETYFFLWNDNEIVGLFKIRHTLNDFTRKGCGHIGYGIIREYRGNGYAREGLRIAIDICKDLIKEDEVYLSVHKDNLASLKVQIENGAYIVDETSDEYLTRIKLNRQKQKSINL